MNELLARFRARQNRTKILALGGGVLLLLLLLVPTVSNMGGASPRAATTTTLPDSGEGMILVAAGGGCDQEVVASAALRAKGFTDGEFVVGASQIDWGAPEANERGNAAFSFETPRTARELVRQLSADDEAHKAALDALLAQSGARRQAVLDPGNWVAAQLTVPSSWDGNTARKGGKAVSAGTRQSQAGDVVWLFVDPDKCVRATEDANDDGAISDEAAEDAVTAHRAGCGNPQLELPRPSEEPTPTTTTPPPTHPPTTGPPTPTTTSPPTTEPPKCFDAQGNPIYDGEFCGTEDSGPEQQPVQDNDPDLIDPTPGYEDGNAEEVTESQEDANDDGVDDPSPYGEPAPSEEGTAGETETPGGGSQQGGNDGVSNPEPAVPPSQPPVTGDTGGF